MTLKEQIMKLQTYKMYEGEDTVYVERDDVLKALDQEPITWIVGKDNCQVAVRNMPIDKMQKICAIIGEEEQQPCEDCVSREALINEMKLGYFNKDLQEGKNDPCVIDAMIDWAIRLVKRQPSVTPQQARWIPVSERLPEENIHVLCQFYMGGMAECYHAHDYWHIVGGFRIKIDEVLAWMPLPEPYKAESEGKE